MIAKVGRKWILWTSDGSRRLGEHSTKREAEAQERAIKISRARRSGYRIPNQPYRRRRT